MSAGSLLVEYADAYLAGAKNTLALFGISSVVGIVLGLPTGLLISRPGWISKTVSMFSLLASSIPTIVLLFWCYYPLQSLLGIQFSAFATAAGTLCIISTIGFSALFMEANMAIPRQYVYAIRLNRVDARAAFWTIRLPLVVRSASGRILSLLVTILHSTLFAALITVEELFLVSQRINAKEYDSVAVYTMLAVVYLLLSLPLVILSRYLTSKFGRDLSEV